MSLINSTNNINGCRHVPCGTVHLSAAQCFDHLPRNTLNIYEFVSREPHATHTRLGDLDNEKEEKTITVVTIEQTRE